MMKFSKLILALVAMFVFTNSQAGTIYLEFDKSCMDRYEYRYNDFNSGFGHIVYHVRLNDKEKVILEVGIESRVNRDVKPSETKVCSQVDLNERMVRNLNKGEDKIFMVLRTQNGYNVSKVGLGSYAQIAKDYYGISSYDNMFVYKYKEPANNKNIASKGSEAKVYFNGVVSYDCPKKYQFTKTLDRAGRNYTEMTVIPEIGVIEEKTGFNQVDAENNKLMLVSINGVPFDQYSGTFCSNRGTNYAPLGSFYNNVSGGTFTSSGNASGTLHDIESGRHSSDPVFPKDNRTTYPGNSNGDTFTDKGPVFNGNTGTVVTETGRTTVVNQPATENCRVYKNVDKGLYYDWYTGQLASGTCYGNTYVNGVWNNGQTTVVTQPTNTTVVTRTETVDRPVIIHSPTTRPTPTPVVNSSACNKYSKDGFHVVQKTETLYGIARLYGVSVGQLQAWNGLGRRSLIQPCSELKITNDVLVSKGGVPSAVAINDNAGGGSYHKVNRGETIYKLANRYGLTPQKLREINALSSNDIIYVGQQLRVSTCNCPATGIAYADRDPATLPVPAEYDTRAAAPRTLVVNELTEKGSVNYYSGGKRRIHVVSENETIYSIAKKFGITVEQIRFLNDLEENEVIIPFQRLYLN